MSNEARRKLVKFRSSFEFHQDTTSPLGTLHSVALSDLESMTAVSPIASSNALPDSALVQTDLEK